MDGAQHLQVTVHGRPNRLPARSTKHPRKERCASALASRRAQQPSPCAPRSPSPPPLGALDGDPAPAYSLAAQHEPEARMRALLGQSCDYSLDGKFIPSTESTRVLLAGTKASKGACCGACHT